MHFRRASLAPLNHREFRLFILVRFFYVMALRMVATVVAYQLFQLTKSSFAIGIVGLSEFIPVFTLALYAGHKIDRSDKRTLLLKGILAYSVCVVALIIVTSEWAMQRIPSGSLPLFFYAIIFASGIIRAFAGPTSSALISQVVPRNVLHFAASLSSSTFLFASIMGHASAGFLIAWLGVNGTFYLVLGYVLIAAVFLSFVERK